MSCEKRQQAIVDLVLADLEEAEIGKDLEGVRDHMKNCKDCRDYYFKIYNSKRGYDENMSSDDKRILRWFVDEVRDTAKKCVKCGDGLDPAYKYCSSCSFPSPFFDEEEMLEEEREQTKKGCDSDHMDSWVQDFLKDGEPIVENFCPYCGKSLEKFK